MNIKQQLESKLSEIYYSNSGDDYDEYLNVENDAEEILQSILKAIMGKAKQLKKEHGEFCSNDHRYNTVLEEFESVIKEILDAEPKKGTKNLDALDATNQNK